jgi:serine/threonine-protein kinase
MPQDPPHQPEWLDVHQPSQGRYVLGPLLGEGGSGEVREAWDVLLCRNVALKLLRSMEPDQLIRFLHEAQVQSRLVHPNICRVYDVDTSVGMPKLAMQLVRGPTLAEEALRLSVPERVAILATVAEAVHAAHRMQLIHRDLKPSNILLERGAGGVWVPYVCDFGLALALDEPARTLNSGLLGTLAYMAPEQVLGQRSRVGPATDVYALGGTLHFALFGEPPGPGVRDGQPLVFPARIRVPAGREQSLPPELAIILRRCLEREPERRYPSAQALAEDLWLFHAGAPIRTRPAGALRRGWRRLRPYRPLLLGALLAACLVMVGQLVEMGRMTRAGVATAEWTRYYLLLAADLEQEVRLQRMMASHDLRPGLGHIRLRLAELRARLGTQCAAAQGPGHYALGCGSFVLRDAQTSRQELEQAWALGFQTPETARLLGRSLMGCLHQSDDQARFRTGQPAPEGPAVAARVRQLFHAGGDGGDMAPFYQALLAYTRADYPQAARWARASFQAHPWHSESAIVASMSLAQLGRQLSERGNLAQAEAHFRQAMAAAQAFINLGPSDPHCQHAYLFAGTLRVQALLDQGQDPAGLLAHLDGRCQAALRLDPTQPNLQRDRITLALLRAARQCERGRDDGPELATARALLERRPDQAPPVQDRILRMVLHWREAQRSLGQGRAPDRELALAMQDLGHSNALLPRDHLGEVLNFAARLELCRGRDPRPALARLEAQLRPSPDQPAAWTTWESLAEAACIRAAWEGRQGLSPSASLAAGRDLADRALAGNPRSARGHALKGLAELLAAQSSPEDRAGRQNLARQQLQMARALGPPGRLQADLAAALGEPARPWGPAGQR